MLRREGTLADIGSEDSIVKSSVAGRSCIL